MLTYNCYKLLLKFSKVISFPLLPSFLFRSILGNELKQLSCVLRGNQCNNCPLQKQCAYSVIFESPIEKENKILKGRNKASHPFIMYSKQKEYISCNSLELQITLFGKAIEYFPYIFYALKMGGQNGILKNRIKYEIEDILVDNKSILKNSETLITDTKPSILKPPSNNNKTKTLKYLIELSSPLRIKKNNRYLYNIEYEDLLTIAIRRYNILNSLYGTGLTIDKSLIETSLENKKQTKLSTNWIDLERYSARQKTTMKLGGLIGIIEICGKFNHLESWLIENSYIMHLGKNISFGLGKILVREGKI